MVNTIVAVKPRRRRTRHIVSVWFCLKHKVIHASGKRKECTSPLQKIKQGLRISTFFCFNVNISKKKTTIKLSLLGANRDLSSGCPGIWPVSVCSLSGLIWRKCFPFRGYCMCAMSSCSSVPGNGLIGKKERKKDVLGSQVHRLMHINLLLRHPKGL